MSVKRDNNVVITPASSIILDIEGTTSSISFVKDVLFPYVRKHLEAYISNSWDSAEFQEILKALRIQVTEDLEKKVEGVFGIAESGTKDDLMKAVISNVTWQMDNDRKTKSLKDLQGMIMEEGYKKGELKGHVYDDVEPSLKSWSEQDKLIYIYSSGSVHAQKLLFGHSENGDLLHFIKGHFDTTVGKKDEVESYKNILDKISCSTSEAVFLTDVPKEARAAKEAGISAILVSREGNSPLTDEDTAEFPVISSFVEVEFEQNIKKRKLCTSSDVNGKNKTFESCIVSVQEENNPNLNKTNDVEMMEIEVSPKENTAMNKEVSPKENTAMNNDTVKSENKIITNEENNKDKQCDNDQTAENLVDEVNGPSTLNTEPACEEIVESACKPSSIPVTKDIKSSNNDILKNENNPDEKDDQKVKNENGDTNKISDEVLIDGENKTNSNGNAEESTKKTEEEPEAITDDTCAGNSKVTEKDLNDKTENKTELLTNQDDETNVVNPTATKVNEDDKSSISVKENIVETNIKSNSPKITLKDDKTEMQIQPKYDAENSNNVNKSSEEPKESTTTKIDESSLECQMSSELKEDKQGSQINASDSVINHKKEADDSSATVICVEETTNGKASEDSEITPSVLELNNDNLDNETKSNKEPTICEVHANVDVMEKSAEILELKNTDERNSTEETESSMQVEFETKPNAIESVSKQNILNETCSSNVNVNESEKVEIETQNKPLITDQKQDSDSSSEMRTEVSSNESNKIEDCDSKESNKTEIETSKVVETNGVTKENHVDLIKETIVPSTEKTELNGQETDSSPITKNQDSPPKNETSQNEANGVTIDEISNITSSPTNKEVGKLSEIEPTQTESVEGKKYNVSENASAETIVEA